MFQQRLDLDRQVLEIPARGIQAVDVEFQRFGVTSSAT
jgi:hypothetical protein